METDYAEFERKTPGDRTVMNVLYGMHTVAPFTLWSLSVIALIINYIRRADEHDSLYVSHHNFMIATFWWALVWLVLTSPLFLLLFFPGMLAWMVVGLWYLYRCISGWLRFTDGRPPR